MKKPKLPSLSRIKKALYADWSLRVRTRDGFKCLLCGATENLTSHHWYCSDHHAHAARYAIANGATLCYACHIRGIHTRADYVSVNRLKEAIGVTDVTMMLLDRLIAQELSTALLRELWDGMRKRPIIDSGFNMTQRGGKLFLYTLGNQTAVVGNIIRVSTGCFEGDYDVAVVTSTTDGYRYTLKKLEDAE